MNKTKTRRINRYHRLASKYRPRAPLPLEQVIRVLVRRQEKINTLVRLGRRTPNRVVSVTIDGLVAYTGLTRKQVRDALETLREAKLIKFERQHRGVRGWGRAFYDCQALVIEIYKPASDLKRLMAEADYRAYLEDRALEQSTGRWGVPRYDEELRREVKEALREMRADEQAQAFWLREELEEFAARALAQYEIWNLPGHLGLQDAHQQAHHDGLSEEEAEAIAHDARERAEYLAVWGPVFAVIGIPGYEHLLPDYLRADPAAP